RGDWIFWTIVVEMKFYIFFCAMAWMLLAVERHISQRNLLFAIAAFWILLLFLQMGTAGFNNRINLSYSLVFFIGGVLAGRLCQRYDYYALSRYRYWNSIALLCCAIIFICIRPVFFHVTHHNYLNGAHAYWSHSYYFSPLMVITLLSVRYSSGIT